jgi:hypothetical protein
VLRQFGSVSIQMDMKSALDDLWRQLRTEQLYGVADKFSTLQSEKFLALYNASQNSAVEQLRRMADAMPRYHELYTVPSIANVIASLQATTPAYNTILEPMRLANARFADITAALSKSLETRAQILDQVVLSASLRHTFDRINVVSRVNFELPTLAVQVWPAKVVARRFGLLEDSLQNIVALERLQTDVVLSGFERPALAERMELATNLVANHTQFVRSLPPAIEEPASTKDDCSEEIGSRLDTKLKDIDPRLAELRRTAWQSFGAGKSGARLAAHGIREVFSELLRRFAPDDDLKQTRIWTDRKDQTLAKPTRRMRFEYIVGPAADDLAALVQFDESINHGNKYAHVFAEKIEVVRAYLGQLESCIYLIIAYALDRKDEE